MLTYLPFTDPSRPYVLADTSLPFSGLLSYSPGFPPTSTTLIFTFISHYFLIALLHWNICCFHSHRPDICDLFSSCNHPLSAFERLLLHIIQYQLPITSLFLSLTPIPCPVLPQWGSSMPWASFLLPLSISYSSQTLSTIQFPKCESHVEKMKGWHEQLRGAIGTIFSCLDPPLSIPYLLLSWGSLGDGDRPNVRDHPYLGP